MRKPRWHWGQQLLLAAVVNVFFSGLGYVSCQGPTHDPTARSRVVTPPVPAPSDAAVATAR